MEERASQKAQQRSEERVYDSNWIDDIEAQTPKERKPFHHDRCSGRCEALKLDMVTLGDWLHTYAPELPAAKSKSPPVCLVCA